MRFRHKYDLLSKEINSQVTKYKYKYGYKPDYLVLNTNTLAKLCGGLSFGQIPHLIEHLRYEVDNDIHGDTIILCEF